MKGRKSEGGCGGVEEESELDWDRRGFGDEKKGEEGEGQLRVRGAQSYRVGRVQRSAGRTG